MTRHRGIEGAAHPIAVELLSLPSLDRVACALMDLGVEEDLANAKAATVVCAAIDGTPALDLLSNRSGNDEQEGQR